MDSSTRLSFLAGTLRIPADEITTTEWLTFIYEIVRAYQPHLKYIGGFVELTTFLNHHLGQYDQRITPPEVVVFPQGIQASTRCIEVVNLVPEDGKKWGRLFLSETGRWFEWYATYKSRTVRNLGPCGQSGTHKIATSSEFKALNSASFEKFLFSSKNARIIVEKLFELLTSTIEQHEEILAKLTKERGRLQTFKNRIQF